MDILIDEEIDKEPYLKKITDDKVINLTGEGGSGKTTYSKIYKNNDNYIVIDYDEIILNPQKGSIEYDLRLFLISKYGKNFFNNENLGIEEIKEKFTIMYFEILNYFKNSNKTIVLDGTQLRFIKDSKMIKGEVIVLRTSLKQCLKNSIKRVMELNPNISQKQIIEYSKKRYAILKKLNPLLNQLLISIEKLPSLDLEFSKKTK